VESLGLTTFKITGQFHFFLSSLDAFHSFSCLTALAGTSSAVLNRSVEGGILVSFFILEDKLSAFHDWV
jgi:hypothetical protein